MSLEDPTYDPLEPTGTAPVPFHALLEQSTPRVWVTPTLIGINGAVFLAMVLSGVHVLNPTVESLLRWGADYGPKVSAGQVWRLLTSMFLHIGLIHILFNMYVLWNIGRFVERLVGGAGYLAVYLVAGLAGAVASLWWHPFTVSAGASGAIFGLYGFLLGFLARNRSTIPSQELGKLMKSALVFVGYNLAFSAGVKGIDMAAHMGGLAGGFLCAVVGSRPLTREGLAARTRAALAASGAVLALLAGLAAALPKVPDLDAELTRFGRMESQAVETYNRALAQSRAHQISDAEFARLLDAEILPSWRMGRERLSRMNGLPREQAESVSRLGRYATLREESWTLLSRALATQDATLAEQARQRSLQAEEALKAFAAHG